MQPSFNFEAPSPPATVRESARILAFPGASSARQVDQLTDAELLAEIVGPVPARALLKRFGDIGAAIGSNPREIARIAGDDAARWASTIHELQIRAARCAVVGRDILSSHSAVVEYLSAAMAHEGREQFRVLYMDKKNQLIVDEVMNYGTVDHAPAYPREIVRRALENDAAAILIAHNHPSGIATPSAADIDMTRLIADPCKTMRITLHDHIVIGRP